MKLVLDTNVLVAAFIAHGNCSELLEHCAVHHEIILSRGILDELQDVLNRKFKFSRDEAHAVVRLLRTRVTLIIPIPLLSPVCRDTDDDEILSTAKTAGCSVIVTGDKDLTVLKQFGEIKIVTPSDFWRFESEIHS
jgi:putative PIN family toxin of toxin-antitoxin system